MHYDIFWIAVCFVIFPKENLELFFAIERTFCCSFVDLQVGPKTWSRNLHCLCNHLSAFGGDFFVAHNPIDFDKVWTEFGNLEENGNFLVLSVVCSIFGIYFVGLVFARKADKEDVAKVGSLFLTISKK